MKKDPSLETDYVEIFQKELPMIIRSESLSFEDQVMLRVFKSPNAYKMELTSESNVSFLYLTTLSPQELAEMIGKKSEDAGGWLRDIFSGEHRYQLQVQSVKTARLWVEQSQKFKSYQLGSFDLEMGSEEAIRESVAFRYERMQIREKMLDGYWETLCGHVKAKNPSILMQMEQRFKRKAFK